MKKVYILLMAVTMLFLTGCKADVADLSIRNKDKNTQQEVLEEMDRLFDLVDEIEFDNNYNFMNNLDTTYEIQDSFTKSELDNYISSDGKTVRAGVPDFRTAFGFSARSYHSMVTICEDFTEGKPCEIEYLGEIMSVTVIVNDDQLYVYQDKDGREVSFLLEVINDEIKIDGYYRYQNGEENQSVIILDYYQNHHNMMMSYLTSEYFQEDTYIYNLKDEDNQLGYYFKTFVKGVMVQSRYEYYDTILSHGFGFDFNGSDYFLTEIAAYEDGNNVVAILVANETIDVNWNLAYVDGWTDLIDKEEGPGYAVYNGEVELVERVPSIILNEQYTKNGLGALTLDDLSLTKYSLTSPLTGGDLLDIINNSPRFPVDKNEYYFENTDEASYEAFMDVVNPYLED